MNDLLLLLALVLMHVRGCKIAVPVLGHVRVLLRHVRLGERMHVLVLRILLTCPLAVECAHEKKEFVGGLLRVFSLEWVQG